MQSYLDKSSLVPSPPMELALAEWAAAQIVPLAEMPSEDFLVRARAAARRAESLRELRLGIRTTGFLPLPLPEYLATAATRAGVQLVRLLPSSAFGQFVAAPWMALARSAGMAGERLRLLTRLWVAETFFPQTQLVPVFARGESSTTTSCSQSGSGTPGRSMDEQSLAARLTILEAGYDEKARAALDACLNEEE